MDYLHHILKKHRASILGILSVVIVLAIYISSQSQAAFAPGTELDPNCEPGDPGCIVTAGGVGTLAEVLVEGNETGTSDILVDITTSRNIKQDDGDGFSGTFLNGINFNQTSGINLFSSNYSGLFNNGSTQVTITPTSMTIDGDSSFAGAQYFSDYSGNYTNRSLVDKEYVDNAAGGGVTEERGSFTWNITDGNGSHVVSTSGAAKMIFFHVTASGEAPLFVSIDSEGRSDGVLESFIMVNRNVSPFVHSSSGASIYLTDSSGNGFAGMVTSITSTDFTVSFSQLGSGKDLSIDWQAIY